MKPFNLPAINKYNQIMQEHQQARQRITPYVLTHNINTGETYPPIKIDLAYKNRSVLITCKTF